MKVVLFDLDISSTRHSFPNLALMKLSAYHKKQGDDVYLNFPLGGYDIGYASCVFSWNKNRVEGIPPIVKRGGSALDLKKQLPTEIEHIMPDYGLYPYTDFSLGYTSRGCGRKCPWCLVNAKEGDIQAWASFYEFWDRRHGLLKLLDNNALSAPNWNETASGLIKEQIMTDFNQGLDIRCVDDKVAYQLARIRTKKLRFAFDYIGVEPQVREGIKLLFKAGIKVRHLAFYVLVGFKGDAGIDRMKILQSYGVDVYPMIYKDETGKEPKLNIKFDETINFHGGRGNLRKYFRVVGRL